MSDFYQRFGLTMDVESARKLFVNRLAFSVFYSWLTKHYADNRKYEFEQGVLFSIGESGNSGYTLYHVVGKNFYRLLKALEYAHRACALYAPARDALNNLIQGALSEAETDIGVRWERGKFWPAGAALLDSKLASNVLEWLRKNEYATVYAPYEKGLSHFLSASKDQRLLSDVVTDMYEALEALAGVVLSKPKPDLSAMREQFIAKVQANDAYKKLLAAYVDYANIYRHAAKGGEQKPELSEREVESFVYMTGIFIRLAM